MVSSDTIVGIVGAVILTGAMIAVFYYENSTTEVPDVPSEGAELYTVQWVEESHAVKFGPESDTVNEGQSREYMVQIPNFTYEVSVSLTWSDDVAASPANSEDTFRVELIADDGTVVAEDEDASGDISLSWDVPDTAPIAGEPAEKVVTVRGDSAEQAQATVKNQTGSVAYTLRVTLVDTNTDAPAGVPGVSDTSNDFEVSVGWAHWHAYEETLVPA